MATDRMLKVPQVLDRCSISRSTLYLWVSQGSFPPPVQLGPRRIAWRESEVQEWMESKRPS